MIEVYTLVVLFCQSHKGPYTVEGCTKTLIYCTKLEKSRKQPVTRCFDQWLGIDNDLN